MATSYKVQFQHKPLCRFMHFYDKTVQNNCSFVILDAVLRTGRGKSTYNNARDWS